MNLETIYSDIIYNKDNVRFVKISNINQFIKHLNIEKLMENNIYYRGQANINWPIKPSIFRDNWIKNEDEIIREMVIRNPADFSATLSTLDKLTKMQHYNAPTRLLDLTRNPFIALYFACEKIKDFDETCYGEIVFFESTSDTEKYYDSDTVSIISNIAMMKSTFTTVGLPADKDNFNKSGLIPYLLHQIQYEKINFLPIIVPDDLHKCLITHVKLDNKRINNQQGLFLLVGMGEAKTVAANIKEYLKKNSNKLIVFLIEEKEKKNILLELTKMNINKGFIYPEIDDVAEYLKNEVYK